MIRLVRGVTMRSFDRISNLVRDPRDPFAGKLVEEFQPSTLTEKAYMRHCRTLGRDRRLSETSGRKKER
jgi:hypothetical protein